MKPPNFFIIGAPKCGTTSLAAWLAEHPSIFMSPAKEPHFFNTDDKRSTTSRASYEALFRDARADHIAVGEASVWYLYSAEAVRNIKAYAPDAKFIVMLRNPIDMAPALHEELIFTGFEDVEDFAVAWDLQDARKQGRRIPKLCWEPRRLLYGEACRLGTQVDRLLTQIEPERLLTIFLDDVQDDVRKQYLRILDFLQVPDDGRLTFPNHNPAKERRWPLLPRVAVAAVELKRKLGIERGLGIWRHIDAANRVNRERSPLRRETRERLVGYFGAEIALLAKLLRRDLRHWVEQGGSMQ
jgi:hypothetical protein